MPEQKYQEDDSMLPKEDLKPNPWAKCKFISEIWRVWGFFVIKNVIRECYSIELVLASSDLIIFSG